MMRSTSQMYSDHALAQSLPKRQKECTRQARLLVGNLKRH